MSEEWFYTNSGEQRGPVTIAALREMAAAGSLQPTDLVWTDGMSTWVPATSARGLFAKPVATDDVPEVQPSTRRRFADDRPQGRVRERRLERAPVPAGMSTGAKILIGVGVAGILCLMLMVAVGVVAGIIAEMNVHQQRMQGGRGMAPGGPQGFNGGGGRFPINPVPAPPDSKVEPVGQKSFIVNLTAANPTEGHVVTFTKGQMVRVTVTTTKWVGEDDGTIDVDLYIYDSRGQLVEWDDDPDLHCRATFVAERTENYTIVIHLCTGVSATCKVDH